MQGVFYLLLLCFISTVLFLLGYKGKWKNKVLIKIFNTKHLEAWPEQVMNYKKLCLLSDEYFLKCNIQMFMILNQTYSIYVHIYVHIYIYIHKILLKVYTITITLIVSKIGSWIAREKSSLCTCWYLKF